MPGDLPHVREKSPGIFLFISYLMYKERYISFSPGVARGLAKSLDGFLYFQIKQSLRVSTLVLRNVNEN